MIEKTTTKQLAWVVWMHPRSSWTSPYCFCTAGLLGGWLRCDRWGAAKSSGLTDNMPDDHVRQLERTRPDMWCGAILECWRINIWENYSRKVRKLDFEFWQQDTGCKTPNTGLLTFLFTGLLTLLFRNEKTYLYKLGRMGKRSTSYMEGTLWVQLL